MKHLAVLLFIVLEVTTLGAQQIPFQYQVKLNPVSISGLPGLHSFAVAQSGGKWLIIGGRKDGLHARQPFNAFPVAYNNTDIYVVDVNTKQFWSTSVTGLATGLKEQLQSTNMNFYQDHDTLYLVGGYGFSQTANDHITYPYLTSIQVTGLISAIVNSTSISPFFKQITDQKWAVNGGQLGKIGSTFLLVGGHRFDGRYNPMGNPTYTQTYVSGIKSFQINNSGSQLSISNYSVTTDQVHLHRRDYNLVPQIFPNGEQGYTISSGVFQVGIDLPFLYPVDVKLNGYTPQTTFNQYLSNYHSAKVALYDSINNVMHSIFFGGMSQYSYVNSVLTKDDNVPFVKTISRVSRDANGNLQENVLAAEMPNLIGASAEFIPNHLVPYHNADIVKLSNLQGDSVLIGHIYGGIYSSQANPFTGNQTSVTNANQVIYEVWLVKSQMLGVTPLNGRNPVRVAVFPNPANQNLYLDLNLPYAGDMDILITDLQGQIVLKTYLEKLTAGHSSVDISHHIKLEPGIYFFNFSFDGRYSAIERVIVGE